MKKNSLGRIIAISGGVIILTALLGITGLWILFPPEKIKTTVTAQAGKMLGRSITIGKAGFSFYPFFGFSLSDLEVANTERTGYSKDAFLKFDQFLLKVSVVSVLKRQPEIKKIVLKKPLIRFEVDSCGNFNFDDLAIIKKDSTKNVNKEEQKMPILPVPISLQSFTIEDGSFYYLDNKTKQQLIVDDINEEISFSIDKELKNIVTTGDLSMSKISLKTKELIKPLSNFTVTLHHDIHANLKTGEANITSIRLSLQKVFFNLAGSIKNIYSIPEFDCVMTSDTIALQDLIKEIPVELVPECKKISAAGDLMVGLELKGALKKEDPLPIKGMVRINNGVLKYTELPNSVNKINMHCTFTENSLDIASLKLNFGDNPVALKVRVQSFERPLIDLNLRADMKLDEIKNFAQLPDGSSLSGGLHTEINATGRADPSDPSKISVQGKLDLNNATVLWPPLEKPVIINGGSLISSQTIGNSFSIALGRSKVNLNADIKNYLSFIFPDSTKILPKPDIGFTVTSNLIDVDEFIPPQEKKTKAEKASSGKGSEELLLAPLPGVNMKGSIAVKSIMYNKIPMSDVIIKVNVIDEIANLVLKMGFAGGTIMEDLHADIKNVTAIHLNNKFNINDVEINDVMDNFGGFILKPTTALNRELVNLPKSLLGKINILSDFESSGGNTDELISTLRGTVGLKMTDGTITNSLFVNELSGSVEKLLKLKKEDIKFRNLSTTLHVAEKNVVIDNLKLLSEAGDWSINGDVGFDTKLNISIDNRLPKDISERLLKVQSNGKSIVKGLLQNTQFAQAANLIDDAKIGIPSDLDGRVTLLFSLYGTAREPKTVFRGFGNGSPNKQQQQASQKKQMINSINDKIGEVKDKAQERLDVERKKTEEQLQQKVAEQKQVLQEKEQIFQKKKDTIEEQLKKTAKNKLKKLF